MRSLQWQNAPYRMRGEYVDVSGIGRYLVRPEARGARTWRAYLNGSRTAYSGTCEECKAAVQRVVNQKVMEENR